MQNKIVHIVGPTGVGKTDLAFKLATEFNGDLISADSVQVYKNLDIISGKDIPKDSQFSHLPEFSYYGFDTGYYSYLDFRIFLLDIVDPTFSFTVSHFQDIAQKIIPYISSQNRLSIVVGGTGLYIKSLTEGIDTTSIAPDFALRETLNGLVVADLQKRLPKEKLAIMNDSDRNNKRRLVRAIELSRITNYESRILNQQTNDQIKPLAEFEHIQIGLMAPREYLKEKINARVAKRLEQGAMDEAKLLFADYANLSEQVKSANGYRQLFQFLKNEITFDEAISKWKTVEYQHAKNQMTWFRKFGSVAWHDITKKGYEKDIKNSLKKFLA